jgi:hypothetical protein
MRTRTRTRTHMHKQRNNRTRASCPQTDASKALYTSDVHPFLRQRSRKLEGLPPLAPCKVVAGPSPLVLQLLKRLEALAPKDEEGEGGGGEGPEGRGTPAARARAGAAGITSGGGGGGGE